jgi:hypothetical protein
MCSVALCLFAFCQFSVLAGVHIADSIRHTAGRPDAVWAEANSFFGHDKKHAKMARQEIKNSQGKHLSFHSAAYRELNDPPPQVCHVCLLLGCVLVADLCEAADACRGGICAQRCGGSCLHSVSASQRGGRRVSDKGALAGPHHVPRQLPLG